MMGKKVLAAKSGRAACSCAAAVGAGCSVGVFNAEKQSNRETKSFLTGLTGFTGLREASVKPAKTKPSGVAWIGDIPEGWEVSRVKHHYELILGKMLCATSNNDANVRLPYVCAANVHFEGVALSDLKEMWFSTIEVKQYAICEGDLLVVEGGAGAGGAAICPRIDGIVGIQNSIILVRNKNCRDNRYLRYLLEALVKNGYVDFVCNKATIPHFTKDKLGNVPLPLPPLAEQRAIAAYLDDKCGAIDVAIAEAKKGIEEYKAWKKSLIFEVVTGKRRVGFFNAETRCARDEVVGLPERSEPEGPQGAARRRVAEKMKSSGIPWIGDVPEGWEVCKTLHSLCMPITDGPHTTPELFDDGIPFVSAEAVSCGNGSIDFSHARGFISEAFYNECCRKYIPQRDDIYMIKSGATTGRVAIVDTDRIFTIWSPLAVFRCNLKRAKPRYVFYYLQSSAYQGQVELAWSFGTQQNIGMRALEELKMVLPPLAEQRAIADYLDEKCAAIDAMIAEKEALIADLEAYKKSLIYEAVTGKREVASNSMVK